MHEMDGKGQCSARGRRPQVIRRWARNWRTEAGMNYAVDRVTGRFLMIRPPEPAGVDGQSVVRVVTNWSTPPPVSSRR